MGPKKQNPKIWAPKNEDTYKTKTPKTWNPAITLFEDKCYIKLIHFHKSFNSCSKHFLNFSLYFFCNITVKWIQ